MVFVDRRAFEFSDYPAASHDDRAIGHRHDLF
jgi:hypothetical protein